MRTIGGGGFGVVYEARDLQLHRSVAFKLVRPGRLEAGEDHLVREAEVIAQLSHPNLVTLFDVGRCDHGPYLVLELLRGETLQERRKQGPLLVAEAARIAVEIAKGLAHAHARGVVHRDLKPSNVFLCRDGQVKLLDFGLSRAFGRRRVSGGTPAYMAPEQWHQAPEDERTDVYALGVMLFEMLTGELPFPADDEGEATLSRRKAPALEVPGAQALGDLIARMLEKQATGRPRDGAEVLPALSAVHARLQEPQATPAGPVRRIRRERRALPLAAAGVALASMAALALVTVKRPWSVTPAPRARAILVLPFANVSDSPENEYFSDGLTEEILLTLTRLRELKVAARSSSFYFKNRKVTIADMAQRLQVDVVLEGSVRRDGDRVRIAADLVDARSGFHMWAQKYDRKIEDVLGIQDEIARQVVGALEIVLSRASESQLHQPRAGSLVAYDLHLKARAQLRLPGSRETLDRATALFEQAIAADPQFAQAYAGLCETWLARYELDRAGEAMAEAEGACQRALSRNQEAAEVYVALGSLHLASGRYQQAEKEFQHATTLANGTVEALLGLARTREAQRRPEEAEKLFQQAARLDPGYWRVHLLRGNFLLHGGRYAEAARSYAEEIALTPDNPRAHNRLGAAYYGAGDLEKAVQAWRVSLELAPTPSAYSNTGTSYFYLGRFADAGAMYAKAVELAPRDHRLWGNLGDAYAHTAGREADGMAAYRRALALGEERLRVNPADANAISDLAHYHASLGLAARARQLSSDALKLDPENAYVHYNAALVSARLGATASALEEIERAVALGHQRHLLPRDPGLDPIRGNARFAALLAPPAR